MCTLTQIHIQTCTQHTHSHAHTQMCTHTPHTHMKMCTYIPMCTDMHIYMGVHTHTPTHTDMHTHSHTLGQAAAFSRLNLALQKAANTHIAVVHQV